VPTHTFRVLPSGEVLHRISTMNQQMAFPEGQDWSPMTVHPLDFLAGFGYSGKSTAPTAGMVRLPFTGISQYASISAATLRLFAASTPAGNPLSGEIALLRKDGLWDAVSGISGYTSAPLLSFGISLQTSGGVDTIIAPTASGTGRFYRFDAVSNSVPSESIGDLWATEVIQTITMPASGPQDMQRARWRVRRVGTPTGSARVRIHATVASDGSDDRPTGAALATSSGVLCSTFPTTGTALVNFDFAAPLTLAYNTRYAVVLETDNTALAAFPQALYNVSGDTITYPSVSGTASVGVLNKYAFHPIAYTEQAFVPFHRGILGGLPGAIRTPPFGSIVTRVFPVWTVNSINDFDVTQLIQEWVDSPDYVPDVIAFSFTMVSGEPVALGNLRNWGDTYLIVEEGTNHQLSGLLSGQAILGPALGVTYAVSGTISGQAIFEPGLMIARGLAAALSGQAIFAGTFTDCHWFTARSTDWFTPQEDSWFTPLTSDWFTPPEECN